MLGSKKDIAVIRKKLKRVLLAESKNPNKYEQHITSIQNYLVAELSGWNGEDVEEAPHHLLLCDEGLLYLRCHTNQFFGYLVVSMGCIRQLKHDIEHKIFEDSS